MLHHVFILIALIANFYLAPQVMAEFVNPERRSFEYGEQISVTFKALPEEKVSFSVDGWLSEEIVSSSLGLVRYSFSTKFLKPGEYHIHAKTESDKTQSLRIAIGPPLHQRGIPLHRWGHVTSKKQIDWLLEKGFTGGTLPAIIDLNHVQGKKADSTRELLEYATEKGFEAGLYLHPLASRNLYKNPESRVLRPDGQRISEKTPWPTDPLAEPCRSFAKELTQEVMKAFGAYPAFKYAMLCSEQRTYPGVSPIVLETAKQDIGIDISPYIVPLGFAKPDSEMLKHGIVPDEDPLYRTMKWFYEKGHGTAVLNQDMSTIIKKKRPDVHVTHEPWRLAATRDTAKGLDLIGSWTYGAQDLKRLFFATYLRAPGRKENQKIQALITLYVYGYMVMPIEKSTAKISDDQPGNDPGFTADPDYTRQTLWTYLAQRPDEFNIYWGSTISPDDTQKDPFLTNPESFDIIGEFSRNVLSPYGPAISKTKPAKAKVAVHLSAASTWFTTRQVGWNKCEETLPYTSLLVMNHVPFDILLDDDITEGALNDYEAVVLPHAETFTASVYSKLKEFQSRGGVIIANEPMRASLDGVHLTNFDFTPLDRQDGRLAGKGETYTTADESRELMEKYARQLRPLVLPWQGEITAEGSRVITNTLDGGEIHYHFAINDERTYGSRFGEYKLYFESGVRQRAALAISRPKGSVFYDVLSRKQIEGEWKDGQFNFELWLAGAGGRLIASLPEKIDIPKITVRENVLERGKPAVITINVNYVSGKPAQGVVPLLVNISDGEGRTTHQRSYTAIENGKLDIEIIPAVNDSPGPWVISVEEIIGGATGKYEVNCS